MSEAIGKIQPKKERGSKSENLAWAKEVCNDTFFARLAEEIDLISKKSRTRSKSHYLGGEYFKLKQKKGALAFVNYGTNTIHLTPEMLARMRKKADVDLLEVTVIHEALHITGHQQQDAFSYMPQIGFESGDIGWGKFLNEGMTDYLAFHIWIKIKQDRVNKMTDREVGLKSESVVTYQPNVLFLIKLISYISNISTVSVDNVVDSFVDAYFNGGVYPEGKFRSELLHIFGKDLFVKLMKLDPKDKDFKSNLTELEDFLEKESE